MAHELRYFAYGTMQEGFPGHRHLAAELGESVGRFRTTVARPLVVVREEACNNPGCRLVHRMCGLLPDEGEGVPVEGDIFAIEPATLERLDDYENYRVDNEANSVYLRRTVSVAPLNGSGDPVEAETYFLAHTGPWRRLLAEDRAEMIGRYTKEMAEGALKECCRRDPGHDGPHDIIDVFVKPS